VHVWFGQDRKQETLDEFFRTQLKEGQRKRITAACVDMWQPFTNSIEHWAPNCQIVYDKFHVLQHANKAIDEVRRAEFFRKGGRMRGVVKGQRWLLLTRWMNLDNQKRQQLNELFALNRRVMKAYLLKESLERLWSYRYEGAMHGALTWTNGKTAPNAVTTVTTTRAVFESVILGRQTLADAMKQGDITTLGNAKAISDLFALLVDFQPGFPIVEPSR